jgi:hypothetical protein
VARYLYDANGNRVEVQGELGPVTATYDDQDRLLTYNGTTDRIHRRSLKGQVVRIRQRMPSV